MNKKVQANNGEWLRVSDVLYQRALNSSADYVEQHMPNILTFFDESKEVMFEYAVNSRKINGLVAEFGVFNGYSINKLSEYLNGQVIYGFDSFRGLEEEFLEMPVGSFNLNGNPPAIRAGVALIIGSFKDTLPRFVSEYKDCFSLINIDCDTYEATKTVLYGLGPSKIVPGTMILFDEYFGYHGWQQNEHKAWKEYCAKHNVRYKYRAINHLQVLVEVLP